ncbi:MAG TPA: DsbA family protein [Candidatus Moranbacteria bacterium]|nr:DsbA family protein [Candidatus Moranbacteria bacterium]
MLEEKKEEKDWGENSQEESRVTFEESEEKKEQQERFKNLLALTILLGGIVVGSFFVDIAQFFAGRGYSQKALKNMEVFQDEKNNKTWVAYPDPVIEVTALTVSEEEAKECPNCDATEVAKWIKRFLPTMVVKTVTADSQEGKQLIKKHNLTVVPSLVFAKEIDQTSFYKEEAKILFQEQADKYVLDIVGMGAPVGKYLSMPEIRETDPVIGNREAEVKLIVYSDYQCPFCSKYFEEIVAVAKEFKDQVALTYKDFPLDFHPQAMNAALAARCANEQGSDKFWNLSEVLYAKQKDWESSTGKEAFKSYARQVGLDLAKYDQCMEDDKYLKEIQEDVTEARAYGVSGTPASFIGDNFAGGVVTKEKIKEMIQLQLEK